ncbi:MAG: hypothetical protein Q8N74_02105, partial [Sulfuricella sp.]|nr:hypothetical protein [Sulfuricella sp.]
MIKARAVLAVLADFKGLNGRKLSLGSVHPFQKSLDIHSRHIRRHTPSTLRLRMDQLGCKFRRPALQQRNFRIPP